MDCGIDFDCALTILTTVNSTPAEDRAILDAGLKSITTNQGLPRVKGLGGIEVTKLSAEHTHLALGPNHTRLKLGDKVEVYPSDTDTTINMHSQFYGVRDGEVEVVWPILAEPVSLGEGHGVEHRRQILPAPYLIHVKGLHDALLPHQRAVHLPQFVHTQPGVRRVVVDLLLGASTQRLDLRHVCCDRERVHACLHCGVGINCIVPQKRLVAHKRDPIIGGGQSRRSPISRTKRDSGAIWFAFWSTVPKYP